MLVQKESFSRIRQSLCGSLFRLLSWDFFFSLFGCARSSLLPGRSLVAASEEYFLAVVAYHVTEHGL